jgi:hypothetical protein
MSKKWKMFFYIGVVLCLASGCVRTYNLKPLIFEPGLVAPLKAGAPVNLINIQPLGTMCVFKSGLANKWVGDLGVWTDEAIGLMSEELQKRNVKLSPDARKTLSIAVTSGRLYSEFAGVRCIIKMKVSAGNGYSAEFEGNNLNPSPLGEMARYYAGANALSSAVIAVLNDRAIRAYLEE